MEKYTFEKEFQGEKEIYCGGIYQSVREDKTMYYGPAIDRLREYEELGLTAEQIKEIIIVHAEKDRGELAKSEVEESLKLYYCKSKDKYLIGRSASDTFFGEVTQDGVLFRMSGDLERAMKDAEHETLRKKYIDIGEIQELTFYEWLVGFLKQNGIEI